MAITVRLSPATRYLGQIAKKLDDTQRPLKQVGVLLTRYVRTTFQDQSSPYGVPWAPLADSTLINRARKRLRGASLLTRHGNTRSKAVRTIAHAKPLLDTFALRNSISFVMGQNSVTIGTPIKYAPTQQFGARKGQYGRNSHGPIPWGNVPDRPFVPIQGEAVVLPASWNAGLQSVLDGFIVRAVA